jgi:hypothetical protein
MTKLLPESLYEFRQAQTNAKLQEEELNEKVNILGSPKVHLQNYIQNKEKGKEGANEYFLKAFAKQIKRFGDSLKKSMSELDDDTKLAIANKGIEYIQKNPGKDIIQLPVKKSEAGAIVDLAKLGEFTGRGVSNKNSVSKQMGTK